MLQLTNNVFNDSIGKIADALLRLASCSIEAVEQERVFIYTPFTHQELANNVGCSRITVTRCIYKFINEGIVSYQWEKIILNDPIALK